jgi:hypothetical protein
MKLPLELDYNKELFIFVRDHQNTLDTLVENSRFICDVKLANRREISGKMLVITRNFLSDILANSSEDNCETLLDRTLERADGVRFNAIEILA